MYLFSFLEIPLVVPKTKQKCVKPEEKKGSDLQKSVKKHYLSAVQKCAIGVLL